MTSFFRHKIENAFTIPQKEGKVFEYFLTCISKLYAIGIWWKNKVQKPPKRLSCKVISIGNIVVGGTGKTPMTLYIAQMLKAKGFSITIISRGYEGLAGKQGAIVSDGRHFFLTPQEAGDEPYMMAVSLPDVPVLVGRNRYETGLVAIKKFNPKVILLDDGFQHQSVCRNVDLVLLDATHPFGNGALLPRGPLRESPAALERSTGIVFTRTQAISEEKRKLFSKPSFFCRHVPFLMRIAPEEKMHQEHLKASLDSLKGENVTVFSGIARNDLFFEEIHQAGANMQTSMGFKDHYEYAQEDLSRIMKIGESNRSKWIVTTEKDFARLGFVNPFKIALAVIGITLDFGPEADQFQKFILEKLSLSE